MKISLLAAASFSTTVLAASPSLWSSQSIYQLLTDRFARTDGSTNATCDVSIGKYCGGTYQGIINHLDYIQNMGFTAVCVARPFKIADEHRKTNADITRSGYLLSSRIYPRIQSMETRITATGHRIFIL
jgi:Alpha amylase, catalytic domain